MISNTVLYPLIEIHSESENYLKIKVYYGYSFFTALSDKVKIPQNVSLQKIASCRKVANINLKEPNLYIKEK